MEIPLVQVKVLENARTLFRTASNPDLQKGDICVAETKDGEVLAEVLSRPWNAEIERDRGNAKPLYRIVRKAEKQEVDAWFLEREFEKEARHAAREAIRRHKLPMKFVRCQHRHNPAKTVFYFTAEGRIDFRELVKDLAGALRVRIEMRQIGVRDEAKSLGGLGRCGQETCCSRFLEGFSPVSIKMAKTQGLSLIPAKISGQCGRLLCCLTYENDHYRQARKELPRHNNDVNTPMGLGRVRDVDYLRFRVKVSFGPSNDQWFRHDEVAVVKNTEELERIREAGPEAFMEATSKPEEMEPEKTSTPGQFDDFYTPSEPLPDELREDDDKDNKPRGRRSRGRGGRRRGGRSRSNDGGGGGRPQNKADGGDKSQGDGGSKSSGSSRRRGRGGRNRRRGGKGGGGDSSGGGSGSGGSGGDKG